MKTLKKITSLLLALVMAFAMTISVSAAQGTNNNNGTITINNAVIGQTYKIYQILVLESYNADTNAYSYKANTYWNDWLNSNEIKGTYVEIDTQNYVTWKSGADAAAFAKAAQKYASENNIANQGSVTATTTTVSFTGLNLGYYLVDTTLGTLCSLDTTNPNVEMAEKNEVPVNVKTVEEDSTGVYGEKNDADIGQTVNFKSTITAQAGAENYVFHDKMSEGLTYTGVTEITLNGTKVDASNYTVVTEGLTDGCTFEVSFTQAFCDTLKKDDKIVISYTATVNKNAVVGLPGNGNTSKLSYGDSSNTKYTPDSTTTTYTWDLDVLKYANGDESKVLKDAQFVLLNKDKNMVATIVSGKITGWVDVPAAGKDGTITWPANTVLTTNANGKIKIDGLDADTYYLREVKAPDGYNKLANDVEVVIKGATTVEGKLTYTTVVSKVNNQSGTELPSTGGMGTTVLYIAGGILVLLAVVLLFVKRRRSEEA